MTIVRRMLSRQFKHNYIWAVMLLLVSLAANKPMQALAQDNIPPPIANGYMVPACVYEGDTIANFALPVLHIFKPLRLTTREQVLEYRRLVRDVKRVLPFAKMVSETLFETYEYMETLPTERAKAKHLRQLEKDLIAQYTPELKKLTLRQGKLLIKLINRECNSSSYGLIDAFLGRFSASMWNGFAKLFGASLKTDYDPEGEDAVIERVCVMVERGYL